MSKGLKTFGIYLESKPKLVHTKDSSKMDPKLLLVLVACGLFAEAHVLKHHIVVRSADDDNKEDSIDDDWWRTGIFYQIYPRSFMDSDGDGSGDLQGIISKLDHLKDMGVTAAWLSPIYESPDVDQGYDISNYTAIDKKYGTIEDLELLISKAHELGIKIIMDFVPNHTSDQHDWFLKSVENDVDYKDFYIWKNSTNNWLSEFSGSAWDFNNKTNQYYLHQFSSGQPDLNYRNPAVVKAMKEVLRYWLDFEVDGFRMDAVPFLFEDEEFKDEPLSGNDVNPNQYGYLKHIYTANLDETYDMIYQFRTLLDDYNKGKNYSRIMMTEAYTDLSEQAVAYYGNKTHSGAHFTFNFNLITGLSSSFTVDDIISNINKWLSHLPKKYVSNWVLGNHDQHRIATRLGVENIDAFNMLTAFLPGIQVTYMGEEIGMEDGYVNCSQGYDPQAIKNCTTFNQTSRDFERTPFQWDDSDNGGFSNTSDTWLPVSDNYKTTNLKAQNVTGIKSHYNVYKSMVEFRKNFKNISYDAVSLIKVSDNVLQIVRTTDKAEFVYLFNCADENEKVSAYTNNQSLTVLVAGINSQFSIGDVLPNTVTLQPHESIVLQAQPNKSSANQFALSTWLISLLLVVLLNKCLCY